jgi:hypothetical protein
MLPTTKETNNRIKRWIDSTCINKHNYDDDIESSESNNIKESQDPFYSYEDTFLSSDFHDMYNQTHYDNTESVGLEYSWTYPFESHLSVTGVTGVTGDNISKALHVYICLYRVCKGANNYPYLQYKLKIAPKTKTNTSQMVFPSISTSNDISSIIKRADEYVSKTIHCQHFEYKGMYYLDLTHLDVPNGTPDNPVYSVNNNDSSSESSYDSDFESYTHSEGLYLFYYDMSPDNNEGLGIVSVNSKTEWWWVCIHEIFNTKRVLQYRVGRNVTSLFIHQPISLFLVNNEGIIYETPHVLYKGLPNGVSLNEMCKFGPRMQVDDNNVSLERKSYLMKKNLNEVLIHGSYYYFYEYSDALRWACYTYDDDNNTYKKTQSDECYLFRYVVFLGRVKVLVFDKMNGATNHVPIRGACMTREHNWPLSGYDSIYHGKYSIKHDNDNQKHKNLFPAFSVCEPHNFLGITYHTIDMKSVSSDIEEMFERKKHLKLK